MKNLAEAADSLCSNCAQINREEQLAIRRRDRARALRHPLIIGRNPISGLERYYLGFQVEHARRSLSARRGWITRMMRSPLSLQIAGEIKASLRREAKARSEAARRGWATRRGAPKILPFPFARMMAAAA